MRLRSLASAGPLLRGLQQAGLDEVKPGVQNSIPPTQTVGALKPLSFAS